MRKTSQDGGDATSATSGVENEMRKPKAGLLIEFKSKKLSKRTANLSEESDDAVVEPLLQKPTEKALQSAKYFAKAKADTVKEISKMFNDKKAQSSSTSGFGTTESLLSEKDNTITKPTVNTSAPLHNHMNTNVFHSHDRSKANGTAKTQVLVEIDTSKQSGYNPSPLIFTTAKIHTDGKSKHMEPVQMTPAPILSTIEVSVSKSGNITTNEKKISNGSSVMNTVFTQPQLNEKTKENTIHISGSNLKSNGGLLLTDNNLNPTTPIPDKANSPSVCSHSNKITEEGSAYISKFNNITPVAQSKDVTSSLANSSQGTTSFTDHSKKTGLSSETTKSNSFDDKNKLNSTKDIKEVKKLVDEPRILMSESKFKSTIPEKTKTMASPISIKPTSEILKDLEPSSKIIQSVQSHKINTVNSNFEQHTKLKNEEYITSKPQSQSKNIKSPVGKPNTNTAKSLQKNTTTESSTSKISDSFNDPSTKTSSTKILTQSKNIDNKLGREIDKSPKLSANQISNSTSASTVKPAQNVSPAIASSNITENSNKATNNSNNQKITVATTVSTFMNVSASSLKAQSSPKTSTATENTNPASVTVTKSTTKASTASINSPPTTTSTGNTNPVSVTTTKSTTKDLTASIKSPPTSTAIGNINPASVTATKSTTKDSTVSIKSPPTSTATGNTNPVLVTATKSTTKASTASIKSPPTTTSTGNTNPVSVTTTKSTTKDLTASIKSPPTSTATGNINPASVTATKSTTKDSTVSIKSPPTSTATGNTNPVSVTTTKSTTKVSTASIKSPPSRISTKSSAAKQPNVSAKTSSVKPPPLAFTKTPQVNTSSPGISPPIGKTAISKVTHINTNTEQKSISPSTPSTLTTLGSSSSTHSETSNKTKAELNKKVGSKLSDQAKYTKVSKA